MRILNLSGLRVGDNLNISVSQNALTAGPVNVPAWGGAGGDGGTISIVAERTHMTIAPDTVRFTVDLSNSDFDTQGPGAGEVYDPRMHDLIYLWDMGDTVTTWKKPVNVLTEWKDRNVAKGPFIQHMYPQAGTYTPSVLVIEPSTGKTATASVEVTVLDPDTAYTGANTICVNPMGDNDFTGAPSGAAQVNIDNLIYTSPVWTARKGGKAKRWLFKRGAEFQAHLRVGSDVANGLYFGSYGTGAKPVLRWDGAVHPDLREMNCFSLEAYGVNTPSVAPDIRFVGLDFRGDFDPTTTRSDYDQYKGPQPPIRSLANVCGMISDCEWSGWQCTNINLQGSDKSREQSWHIDDCGMTAFGGQYAIFGVGSDHARSSFSITGCLLAQSIGAMGNVYTQGSSRAILRSSSPHRFHMRCNDSYHTDYNQHHYVPFKDPIEHGGVVNIHSCSMEGGGGGINLHANPHGPGTVDPGNSVAFNAIIDGCFYFCNHSSKSPFYSNGSGITFRNLHCVQPSVSRVTTNNVAMVEVITKGTFDETLVGNAPIKVYNCTYIYLKTDAQCVGWPADPLVLRYEQGGASAFNVLIEENNILHKPNTGTPVTPFAPLTEKTLFAHRDRGYWGSDPGLTNYPGWKTTQLGGRWNNGETKTWPYGKAYSYIPITQANFAGSNGKEEVEFGFNHYTAEKGDISVNYGATEISVTNTSGVDWVANNSTSLYIYLDMGSTAPVGTDTVPPAGSWKDYRPAPGSAALGAALNGNVSYMDITLQDRPEPPSMGAWEAE